MGGKGAVRSEKEEVLLQEVIDWLDTITVTGGKIETE